MDKGASNHNYLYMNNIEGIIVTALQSQDNYIRANAEAQIYDQLRENPPAFFVTLSQIISN